MKEDVLSDSKLVQQVVHAALSGATLQAIRKSFKLTKKEVRRILSVARVNPVQQPPPAPPPIAGSTILRDGNDAYVGLWMPYNVLEVAYPKHTAAALRTHRTMKSKSQHDPPNTLEWYYIWTTPFVKMEDTVLELHEFVLAILKKCYPFRIACRSEGLRLRTSELLTNFPPVVKREIALTAEQWWRDPKVVEATYGEAKVVNAYAKFGIP